MSVADGNYTLLDFHKELGPKGSMLPVVEVLNQVNDIMQDAPITPSNAMLGHRTEWRTGLPAIQVGQFERGIAPSKATAEQHEETIAMFTTRDQVDLKYKKTLGVEKFEKKRMSAGKAVAEGFSQFVTRQIVYGSVAGMISTFDGFMTRMQGLQQPYPGTNGSQVVSNGNVAGGDGTSLLIVDWHPDMGCHLIYPEGSATAGLMADDLTGENGLPVNDANNNSYQAAVREYFWQLGLAVEDPRHMARIPNVDVSDANLGANATQHQLLDTLDDVLGLMPSASGFKRVIYAHPRILTAWRKQVRHASTTLLITLEQYLGEMIPHYCGIPMRRIDQLSTSEGTVS